MSINGPTWRHAPTPPLQGAHHPVPHPMQTTTKSTCAPTPPMPARHDTVIASPGCSTRSSSSAKVSCCPPSSCTSYFSNTCSAAGIVPGSVRAGGRVDHSQRMNLQKPRVAFRTQSSSSAVLIGFCACSFDDTPHDLGAGSACPVSQACAPASNAAHGHVRTSTIGGASRHVCARVRACACPRTCVCASVAARRSPARARTAAGPHLTSCKRRGTTQELRSKPSSK